MKVDSTSDNKFLFYRSFSALQTIIFLIYLCGVDGIGREHGALAAHGGMGTASGRRHETDGRAPAGRTTREQAAVSSR